MEGRERRFAGLALRRESPRPAVRGGGEEEAEESRSGSAAAAVARGGDVDPEESRSGSAAPAARGEEEDPQRLAPASATPAGAGTGLGAGLPGLAALAAHGRQRR